MRKIVFLVLLIVSGHESLVFGQGQNFPGASIVNQSGAPSGNCTGTNVVYVNNANGNFYTCPVVGSPYVLAGGGGTIGTGTVGQPTVYSTTSGVGPSTATPIDASKQSGSDICAKIAAAVAANPGLDIASGVTGQQVCSAANATAMFASMTAGNVYLGSMQLYLPLTMSAAGQTSGSNPTVPPAGTAVFPTRVTIVGHGTSPAGGNVGDTEINACTGLNTPITGCTAPTTRQWGIAATTLTYVAGTGGGTYLGLELSAGPAGNTATNSDVAGGEPFTVMGSSSADNNGDWHACAQTQYISIRADSNCPANPITTANGSTVTLYTKVNPGITKAVVNAGGSSYSGTLTLTFTGCTVNPTGTVTQSGGVINSVTINNPGICNGTTPTVTITGSGGGSGATLTLSQASACSSSCGTLYAGLALLEGGPGVSTNAFANGLVNMTINCSGLHSCLAFRDLYGNEGTTFQHMNLLSCADRCFDRHTAASQNAGTMRDIRVAWPVTTNASVGTNCGYLGDVATHGIQDFTCDMTNLGTASIVPNDGLHIDADGSPGISIFGGHTEVAQFGIMCGEGGPCRSLNVMSWGGPPTAHNTTDGAWQSESACAVKIANNYGKATPGTTDYNLTDITRNSASGVMTVCDDYASTNTAKQYYISDSATSQYDVDTAPSGVVTVNTSATVGNYPTQIKPLIDARDIPGVDCTGATDSAPALTAYTGNQPTTNNSITQHTLAFGNCPNITLGSTWVIYNQAGFILDGWTRSGAGGKGVNVNWTGGGSPMLDMEYVDGFQVQGFNFQGNSTATVGVQIDKNGSGGIWNTTDGRLVNNTYQGSNQNWIGVSISPVSVANVEDMRVEDSAFYCNATVATTNAVGIEIGSSANAKNEIFKHNNITHCLYGVWAKSGSFQVRESEFTGNGGTCASGSGADIRITTNTDVDIVDGNLDENSTQGISTIGSLGHPVVVHGNHAAPASCENTANYWFDVGSGSTPWVITGNSWDSDNNLVKVIGASSGGNQGTAIYTYGNLYPNSVFTPWWTKNLSAVGDDLNVMNDRLLSYGFGSSISGSNYPSPLVDFRAYLGSTLSDDVILQNIPASASGSSSGGTMLFKHQQGVTGNYFFSFDGSQPGINIAQIATPSAPSSVSPQGTTGSTTDTYAIVAYGPVGNTPGSSTTSTSTANATLSSTNYNQVQFTPVAGATKYCIWRTVAGGTPNTTGNIGCISAAQIYAYSKTVTFGYTADLGCCSNPYRFNDTGLAGDSSALPSTNTTGVLAGFRFNVDNATTLVVGDFTVSAGWGTTASKAITVTTSKDGAFVMTVTSSGTGQAANPTVQLTFHDGTWTNTPVCVLNQTGGTGVQVPVPPVTARSATSYTWQWTGTPVAAATYEFTGHCTGT